MTDTSEGLTHQRVTDEEILKSIPSSTRSREAKLGLFVLLGLVSFVVVLFWMTDPATFRGRSMLVTTVADAGGVRAGDPIQMQGVNVGRVNGFEMVDGLVHIRLEIERGWGIPRGSRTTMGEAGLFGGRTLLIEPSNSNEFYQDGDTIPGEGALSSGLLGSVDELSEQAGSVLSAIDSLLNPETVGTIQGSATELQSLLTELSAFTQEQRNTLGDLSESLVRSAEGLEEAAAAGPDVASAIARADSAIAAIAEMGENLDSATDSLRSVIARMDSGEGTLGRLSTDEALYDNLNSAAESVASLLEDLQDNPSKYINLSIF